MRFLKRGSPIAALDIGSSKVTVLVALLNDAGELEVRGVGSHPSEGVKKGIVSNIDSTIEAIMGALTAAQNQAQLKVESLLVGIAGSHLQGLNSHGVVAVERDVVADTDVQRVIEAAKAVALSADQQLLHVIPQDFIVDGQSGVKEPVGMRGVRLESKVHIVTSAIAATQNIVRCVENCDKLVANIVTEQIASAEAVLTADEKEMGVCVVDIGAGTVGVSVYLNGMIKHTEMLPLGGNQVTSDISVALRIPIAQAEQLKLTKGDSNKMHVSSNEPLEICFGTNERRLVKHELLVDVIEARYEEVYTMVAQLLQRLGVIQRLQAGVVLTGGGSNIPHAVEHAKTVLNLPVRHGLPQGFVSSFENLHNPIYATGVGLLKFAQSKQRNPLGAEQRKTHVNKGLGRSMVRWLQENF